MKGSGERENDGSRHDDTISKRAVMDFVGSMEMCDQITADAYKELICYLEDLPPTQPELIRCKDCKFTDGDGPIADGRYWCVLHGSFMYFCSDAERRGEQDESIHGV